MKKLTFKEWARFVESARTKEVIDIKRKAGEALKRALIEAIKNQIPEQKFGILFSGGVDSTTIALICKNLGADFVCYTVGFKDELVSVPADAAYAKKVAGALGFRLQTAIYELDKVEKLIEKTVKLLKSSDIVKVGVGAVVYAGLELAKKDKVKHVFSGLGSEEIFAGYQRHEIARDVQAECWRGLEKMYERDLIRDFAISKHFGIEILTPFLELDVIRTAMQIPAELKLSKQNNKLILREVAAQLGVPEEVAFRKKKAAQYGSNFDKAIKKLAKKRGFAYKTDYLNSLLKTD